MPRANLSSLSYLTDQKVGQSVLLFFIRFLAVSQDCHELLVCFPFGQKENWNLFSHHNFVWSAKAESERTPERT